MCFVIQVGVLIFCLPMLLLLLFFLIVIHFFVSAGYQVGVPAPTTRVVAMDDEEPCWKSLGYCRDLERQPIQDAEVASPLPHTLAARPLPSVGNPEFAKGADSWNLDLCEYA